MLPLWDGFSAFDTEQRARNKAQAFPASGRWIAELEVHEGEPLAFQRTTRARGHYTVWGSPSFICRRVARVIVV